MAEPRFPWHSGGADVEGPYRYRLWREWAPELGRCCFVMLNPSTANAEQDDPTIRRCIRFATDWGFGRLDVVNLYALRSTNPKALRSHHDPTGPRNDEAIREAVHGATVVAAWGAGHRSPHRVEQVLSLIEPLEPVHALGFTASGAPRHPLYVAAITRSVPWRARWRKT